MEQARWKSGVLDDVKRNQEDNPIVAIGIVAYWLQFNSRMDTVIKRLTRYNCEIPKDIREQFDTYTQIRFEQFRKEHRDDPNTWDWDWEREFYTNVIIPNEIAFNKQSEALFEYITPTDRQLVRDVMKEYILYLQQKREIYLPKSTKGEYEKITEQIRQVDIDKIGNHFKRDFDKKTYLPVLKMFLEQPLSDKDLARIALLIYESKYFLSNDYKTFSKWYIDFCTLVGCLYHESYAPSALKPISDRMKNQYYFL